MLRHLMDLFASVRPDGGQARGHRRHFVGIDEQGVAYSACPGMQVSAEEEDREFCEDRIEHWHQVFCAECVDNNNGRLGLSASAPMQKRL